ncbi:hypothetical protein ACA910_015051 [Epithemia clementina (nom. ined.)]
MLEARLIEGHILKLVIDAVKDLVKDTNIDCGEEEMSIQCMDSAHVSLVAMQLKSGAFEKYRCDRPQSLGLNTENFSKVFKMMHKDDILVLKAEDDAETLGLMFQGAKSNNIGEFDLKLMEIETEVMQIPDTDYKCNVRMPSSEFQRIARDMQVLGDTCTISCTKEGIAFSAAGDIGTGKILIGSNTAAEKDEEQVTIDMEEPVELQFALRYLNMFTKATPLSPVVNISMSPNVPIVIEYPIGEVGFVKFFLAPKIEEDDEQEAEDQQ